VRTIQVFKSGKHVGEQYFGLLFVYSFHYFVNRQWPHVVWRFPGRRSAPDVDRIFARGEAKRALVPRPTGFELLINLKAAKALGVGVLRSCWQTPTR